jgi:hypothetical protein
MKVTIKGNSAEDLQITFCITNGQEKAAFHDRVAINICQGPHKFIAKCHSPQDYPEGDYEIPIKGAYVGGGIDPTMPEDLERQYANSLGRMAQLCDTIIPWLQGAMSGVNDSDIPAEVRDGISEIMDYVDSVHP